MNICANFIAWNGKNEIRVVADLKPNNDDFPSDRRSHGELWRNPKAAECNDDNFIVAGKYDIKMREVYSWDSLLNIKDVDGKALKQIEKILIQQFKNSVLEKSL